MLRTLFGALLGTLLLLSPHAAYAAGLKVVTTVPDLAAIAKEVGGDRVTVTAIALPTQDPHFVDAKPSLALDLARADMLIAVGLGLEGGWLPVLQTGSRNAKIQPAGRGYVEAAQFVELMEVPVGRIDRSMGDIHPGGNPHFLVDPRAVKRVARGIAGRMAELDPAGATVYADNADRFEAAVDAREQAWRQRLALVEGDKVIGYHRTLAYLADWAGFSVIEHVEPKPGIPPDPQHVAKVVSTGRSTGVQIVLIEGYYPANMADMVAGQIGAKLVVLPGGTDFAAGQSWFARMDEVVARLSQAGS